MINEELNINQENLDDKANSIQPSAEKKSFAPTRYRNVLRKILIVAIALISFLLLFTYILYLVPVIQEYTTINRIKPANDLTVKSDLAYNKEIVTLKRDIQKLSNKFNSLTPETSYIVINTTKNRFYLYRNKKLVRQGFCSSGSYTLLITEEAKKQWVFKTPKGRFYIQGKTTNPVWRRPDWSFVEEGLPIPSANHPSRWEYGVLGDYALSIGDGYLIHGTLYKRFLGMPVTHGCIRLNDEDLEAIYKTLDFGSKVYIY